MFNFNHATTVFTHVGVVLSVVCQVNLLQSVCSVQEFESEYLHIWSVAFDCNGKYEIVFAVGSRFQKSVVMELLCTSINMWSNVTPNTVVYFPFKEDLLDHSLTPHNPTWSLSVAITTLNWLNCARFQRWYLEINNVNPFNSDFTISIWRKQDWTSGSRPYVYISEWIGSTNRYYAFWEWSSSYRLNSWFYSNDMIIYTSYTSNWENFIFTFNASTRQWILYKNNVQIWSRTYSSWINVSTNSLKIWTDSPLPSDTLAHFNWYLSDVIIENKVWTQDERNVYFTKSKSKYWY